MSLLTSIQAAQYLLLVLLALPWTLATPSLTPPVVTETTSTGAHSGPSGTVTGAPSGSAGTITSSASETNITTVTTTGAASSTTLFPSLDGVDSCITNCLQMAVGQSNCSSVVDVGCYCTGNRSTTLFEESIVNCTFTLCPDKLDGSEDLAQKFCDVADGTLTFPTPTPTNSVSTTSPPPTETAPVPTGAALSRRTVDAWAWGCAILLAAATLSLA
ncbi:hypothetical protein AURDEDRAFT_187649 [Auricularia subglabra TFB-10046 SS5]|nr:hypothetical protein AURDEDRAFT_187649 [Auricularia subglabra TFB-10046 SS5]